MAAELAPTVDVNVSVTEESGNKDSCTVWTQQNQEEGSADGRCHSPLQAKTPETLNILAFQRRLLKAVEELRLKRNQVADGDHEVQKLLSKQLEVEKSLDSERASHRVLVAKLQSKLLEVQQHCEDRLTQAHEERETHKLQLEAASMERDGLRNQARILQLDKLKLQKQVQELESRLQQENHLQETFSQHEAREKEATEQFARQCQKLQEAQNRVESIAAAASSVGSQAQRRLLHQTCLLRSLHTEKQKLQEQLLEAKAELIAQANIPEKENESAFQENIVRMELQISRYQIQVKQLRLELDEQRKEYRKTLSAMEEANLALGKCTTLENQSCTIIGKLQEELVNAAKKDQQQMEKLQEKEIEIEKLKDWTKKQAAVDSEFLKPVMESKAMQTDGVHIQKKNDCVAAVTADFVYSVEDTNGEPNDELGCQEN